MTRDSRVTTELAAAAERLRGPDMLQVLALFLAALLFVVAVRWPGAGGSNEAWFTLAQMRMVLLALAALGYGAAESGHGPASRRATAGALVMFVVLSAPFDIATYAASYPAAPLWWAVGLPFPATLAYFGLGLGLGRLATWARLGALLPLLVPAVLIVGIWVDVRLGVSVFNPLTAPLSVSVVDGVVMTAMAAATVAWLGRARSGGRSGA
ncbi:MAG: hypothetical protein P8Y02_01960 [Deinococcales bacterium]